MTETSPEPASPPPAAGGPLTRAENWFRGHAGHAEADAAAFAADVSTALRDHAGTVFDVAGDVVQLAKLADPADAPLFAALDALVPKVLAMAESAARIAQGALKST
jgi:hypothetical protein